METEIADYPEGLERLPGVSVPVADLEADLWAQTIVIPTPDRLWAHNMYGLVKYSRPWIAIVKLAQDRYSGWSTVSYWPFVTGRSFRIPPELAVGMAFVEGVSLVGKRRIRQWKRYVDKFVFWLVIEIHPNSLRVLRLASIPHNLPKVLEKTLAGIRPLTAEELRHAEAAYRRVQAIMDALSPPVRRQVLHYLVSG